MRKAYLLLAVAICIAPASALAQARDSSARSAAVATAVHPQATDASADRPAGQKKSAFGQVMNVLTSLLQEAAARQSGAQPDTNLADMASENSAVTITVTPSEGRTTFTVDDTGEETTAPVVDDIATDVQIDGAQLAVQGEDGAD